LEQASAAAASARAHAVARWTALEELAATHSLPTTSTGLAARREQLGALASRLDGHELQLGELSRRVAEWADSADQARRDEEEAQLRLREGVEAEHRAAGVAAEYDELRSTVGASVLELEQRLADLRGVIGAATARLAELQPTLDRLNESIGTTRAQVQTNVGAVGAGELVLESARTALATLVEVPGLVTAGLGLDPLDLQTSDIGQAETKTAVTILGLEPPRHDVDANAVLAATSQLQNGPAATLEPRVAEIHGVLTAAGRDIHGDVGAVLVLRRGWGALGRGSGCRHAGHLLMLTFRYRNIRYPKLRNARQVK